MAINKIPRFLDKVFLSTLISIIGSKDRQKIVHLRVRLVWF